MDYHILGNIIQNGRNAKKLSQASVASYLGCTNSNVSSWERGNSKIDIESLIKLCELYGISYVEVLLRANGDSEDRISLSKKEKEIIKSYRLNIAYQAAVDKLLDIQASEV